MHYKHRKKRPNKLRKGKKLSKGFISKNTFSYSWWSNLKCNMHLGMLLAAHIQFIQGIGLWIIINYIISILPASLLYLLLTNSHLSTRVANLKDSCEKQKMNHIQKTQKCQALFLADKITVLKLSETGNPFSNFSVWLKIRI